MQPEYIANTNSQSAEASLRNLQQELENLKHSLICDINEEIRQLQSRKSRLLAEVEELELQRQLKISQQQQELIEELAPLLDRYIHTQQQSFNNQSFSGDVSQYKQNTHNLVNSLDDNLRNVFQTLEQDVLSYQASLSNKLNNMNRLEQEGELILDALITKIRSRLQTEALFLSPPPARSQPGIRERYTQSLQGDPLSNPQTPIVDQTPPVTTQIATSPEIVTPKPEQPKQTAPASLGYLLILLYSLSLSLYNVITSMVTKPSTVFPWLSGGWGPIGNIMSPSLGNSILVLFLRMFVVVPGMAILASFFYEPTWRDIKQKLIIDPDWDLWRKSVGSGFALFLSQVLIFIAFGSGLTPGVVITIFFIFPIVTLIGSWVFFGERPTGIRTIAATTVFIGVILISVPIGKAANFSLPGIATSIGSGVTFAFYVLLTQASLKKIHPMPFSFINFVTIFVFSIISMIAFRILPVPTTWNPSELDPNNFSQLMIFVLILGILNLLSYLFNNIGIKIIGAALASIFGAIGPVLTTLLAALILGRGLDAQQWLGMIIVSGGVAGLSLEKLLAAKKQPAK